MPSAALHEQSPGRGVGSLRAVVEPLDVGLVDLVAEPVLVEPLVGAADDINGDAAVP